jgi:glycosyltransferase involved in cell wall biosynthesis
MDHLSAVIITLNEERNIRRCLDSLVGVADEVVVLDSFSTDATERICREYDFVRFEQRQWAGYSDSKNYANSLARFPYIFSLDADEALSPELTAAILTAKKNGFEGVYVVNRKTNYCGTWIHHSGWYPDFKIRIFPKATTKWVGAFVHEELEFAESMRETRLLGDLYHYSYYDYVDHRARADKYSLLTAQKMHAAGKKAGPLKPYLSALARFFSMYILKLGFLDGHAGWKIATISAQSNIVKYKTLRQLNREHA